MEDRCSTGLTLHLKGPWSSVRDLKYAGNISVFPAVRYNDCLHLRTAIAPVCPIAQSQVQLGRMRRLLTREPRWQCQTTLPPNPYHGSEFTLGL